MLASLRVLLAVAVISFVAPSASEAQRGGGAIQLPEGAGKDIVQKRCVGLPSAGADRRLGRVRPGRVETRH